MKCDRLISLIKSWYVKVQEEAMAPARMVAFMEKHISQCEECLADPDVQQEADKIREIVLPPSKALKPKVVRVPKEDAKDAKDAENAEKVEESEDETSENEDDDEVIETDADEDTDDDEDEDSFDPDIMDEEEEI
jgi:hypothetical protein